MAKGGRSLEAKLAALDPCREDPSGDESVAALRAALGERSALVVAKAAKIARDGEVAALTHDLVDAFGRFASGGEADKGCAAKTAIAEALYQIGQAGPGVEGVFLRGIRHVQREPVWGGTVDVAAELRGHCAMGLVRIGSDGVMIELADLLADPEAAARAAAARAVGYRGHDDGVPLLRYAAKRGDAEPGVLTELLTAMLALSAEQLPYVEGFLRRPEDEVQEAAALALGQSRLLAAMPALKAWWERTLDRDLRRTALTAIAVLRQDASLDFLVSLIAEGSADDASDAIGALAMYRHDARLCERVVAAASRSAPLRDAVAAAFGQASTTPPGRR